MHAVATLVALACLVRIRVGSTTRQTTWRGMLAIYVLAALPFFTGGAVISLAFSRLTGRINVLYASDLVGAAAGCLALMPLLNLTGARPACNQRRRAVVRRGAVLRARRRAAPRAERSAHRARRAGHAAARRPLTVRRRRHQGPPGRPRCCSASGTRSRASPSTTARTATGRSARRSPARVHASLFMDIDSAASTPILKGTGNVADARLPALRADRVGYHLVERPGGFTALVIGPGGGRDLVSALVFGARRVDGVEINPIIAHDVMLDRFREYSGGLYARPARIDARRGRPQLRAPHARALRRHPGVAGRHLGGHGGRRLHADGELALHGRGVRRLPRPPHRPTGC